MGVGVADVGGDGVAAVLAQDRGEAAIDLGERLVPGGRLELLRCGVADERRREAVGILVQRLEAVRLGAEEAAAEDVVGVAADLDDALALGLDRESAGGFAEGAGAEVGGDLRSLRPGGDAGQSGAGPWAFGLAPTGG